MGSIETCEAAWMGSRAVSSHDPEWHAICALRGMQMLLDDLRIAIRTWIRAPAFAAGAVLTLALGIGAAMAVFTVVNVLLLRPLPYRQPDRLVRVTVDLDGQRAKDVGIAIPELFDLSQHADVSEQVSGVFPINTNLSGTDEPERVEGQLVSVNYFAMLGVRAQVGRLFLPSDYSPMPKSW
jgi:putative ABC transport system permease protein